MKTNIFISQIIVIVFLSLISCNNNKEVSYKLRISNPIIKLSLDKTTKISTPPSCLYKDTNGTEYITFQNSINNEIEFYNISSQKLEFKIKPEVEGQNGVGFFSGYYIQNLDSIFITNGDNEEISLIDRNVIVKNKFDYHETKDKHPLKEFYSTPATPISILGDDLYIVPSCNRWAKVNPVAAYINIKTDKVCDFSSFQYPKFPGANNKMKRAGVEDHMSRCFDGKRFIYSFHFDEDIYVCSPNHNDIKRYKIKSKYISKVKILNDYGNLTPEEACCNPNYGDMIYDKYRNVYYRIAYPATSIEKDKKGIELLMYGRKFFSIIIVDSNFNVIGETMFPDYTYNSNFMFVRKDGLYISDNNCYNPHYSDDVLSFVRFELIKK
jgi:hypothetical protein